MPSATVLGIDLNNCAPDALVSFCSLGHERARRLVQARPLRSWDDVRRLGGFDDDLLRTLQHAGARLGGSQGGGDRPGRTTAD